MFAALSGVSPTLLTESVSTSSATATAATVIVAVVAVTAARARAFASLVDGLCDDAVFARQLRRHQRLLLHFLHTHIYTYFYNMRTDDVAYVTSPKTDLQVTLPNLRVLSA